MDPIARFFFRVPRDPLVQVTYETPCFLAPAVTVNPAPVDYLVHFHSCLNGPGLLAGKTGCTDADFDGDDDVDPLDFK